KCQDEIDFAAEPPKFKTRGQTYRVVTGETVVLPCRVDNLGPYVILWKRGNAVLSAGEMKITLDPRIQLVDGFSLEIKKVRPQDGGDYICQLSTYTPDEQVHTLEILVPPNVRSEPNNGHITITKGDNVNLQCRGSGNPVPTITWTRKNNLLPNGEQSAEGNIYSIQKADRHQAGVYLCTANNKVGSPVTASIEVKVQYPPEIEVERGWIHSGEGYEAELACIVHSDPPATKVKWYRDTMILDTTERRLMEDRGSRHSLIIRNVQPGDFGNYSCEADNKLGRSRKHIELSGKPNRAVFRSDTVGRMKDAFNITWTVESFSPVDEYRLLYRKKHVNDTSDIPGEWQEVVIPASESYYHGGSVPRAVTSLAATSVSTVHWKSYHIRKLEPGVMYEAEVAARNKYGWAQKSDVFQFNTRSADNYPFESSPQHDVLADPEVRDLGITAASSTATAVHPANVISTLSLCTAVCIIFSLKYYIVSTRFLQGFSITSNKHNVNVHGSH
ncbi:unnamed protein product, partial [Allacma fusca]